MGLQWYARYPGDYLRDTAHLTMLEHGAYTLLMDYYYSTATPLPANADANAPTLALATNPRLYRICRAVTPEEQEAVDSVINDFFKLHEGNYHHARIDEEIEKREEISEKRRAAREARMNKPPKGKGTNAPTNAPTNAGASATANEDTTTTTTTVLDIYIGGAHFTPEMYFEVFWNDYPAVKPKGNKSKALEKFKAIMKEIKDYEQFDRATKEYRKFCDAGNYNQHAVTWLNQRGWETKWAEQATRPAVQRGGKSNQAKAAIMRGIE